MHVHTEILLLYDGVKLLSCVCWLGAVAGGGSVLSMGALLLEYAVKTVSPLSQSACMYMPFYFGFSDLL